MFHTPHTDLTAGYRVQTARSAGASHTCCSPLVIEREGPFNRSTRAGGIPPQRPSATCPPRRCAIAEDSTVLRHAAQDGQVTELQFQGAAPACACLCWTENGPSLSRPVLDRERTWHVFDRNV
eukprot:365107-Chlamydomonas_euryale.AAC.4